MGFIRNAHLFIILFVRSFSRVFAILFEALLIEIQEEITHFAVWGGGVMHKNCEQNYCAQTGVSYSFHLLLGNSRVLGMQCFAVFVVFCCCSLFLVCAIKRVPLSTLLEELHTDLIT